MTVQKAVVAVKQAIHHEWLPSAQAIKAWRWTGLVVILVLFTGYMRWQKAIHRVLSNEAIDAKQEAIIAFDKTTSSGRVLIEANPETGDGRIIRWTAGMTAMTGWTRDEMLGGNLSRLNPPDGPDDDLWTAFSNLRRYPWTADGVAEIVTKEGRRGKVVVFFADSNEGDRRFREIIFKPYRFVVNSLDSPS